METTSKSILIVEDEGIVAEDLRLLLTLLGYGVTDICSDGEAAIRSVQRTTPDLLLMDINLQGALDGIETAQDIRARVDLPIIFLTAYADDATLERARGAANYGYILKPFESREIHLSVEIALHKHASERRAPDAPEEPADEHLVARCRELREIIRQKDRLFGILSEDKSRPQNMLLHYCEKLLSASPPAAHRNTDAPVADAIVAQDLQVTDELLEKYISLPIEHLRLSEQVTAAADWFATRFHSRNIALRTPGADLVLDANPRLMQFLLRHAILAALEYTPVDGMIELCSKTLPGMAEISFLFPVERPAGDWQPISVAPPAAFDAVSAIQTLRGDPSLARCEQIARLQGGSHTMTIFSETQIRISFTIPSGMYGPS
jgi:CheY-like chemotaxis protein